MASTSKPRRENGRKASKARKADATPRSGKPKPSGKEDKPFRPARAVKDYREKAPRESSRDDRSKKEFSDSRGEKGAEKSSKRPRTEGSPLYKPFTPKKAFISKTEREGLIRLNRYLSNAGIASRREADELIELGLVSVNGVVVKELGTKVDPQKDVVKYDDAVIRPEKFRYVLLNKPKDYITTAKDPEGRQTVMELVSAACKERIYPVGRLDRQTTGLLLFTNDGDLAKRLTHPKHGFPKLYHVELSEKVRREDLDKIRTGVELEDGFVKADEADFVGDGKDQQQVGIRVHSGRNRIVRRIFEHLGYTVKKLDRVMFAGLTKKDLPRGRYRHLTEAEVGFLKMIR